MADFRFLKNVVFVHMPTQYEWINSTLVDVIAPIRYGPPMRGGEFYPLPKRSPLELIGVYTPKGQGMKVEESIKAYREMYGMKEPSIPLLTESGH